jgi:hypothetical protein
MSDKFSLISEYTTQGKAIKKSNEAKVETAALKVKYQEYLIEIDSKECSVYIPIRECESFENVLEHSTNISAFQLKKLLREFRGIRNIG